MDTDILIHLEKIEGQVNRLVADAESEKNTRKERNADIDRRLLILEKDKIKKDLVIWGMLLIGGVAGSVIQF